MQTCPILLRLDAAVRKETYPKLFPYHAGAQGGRTGGNAYRFEGSTEKAGTSLRMVCCTPASKSISMPADVPGDHLLCL